MGCMEDSLCFQIESRPLGSGTRLDVELVTKIYFRFSKIYFYIVQLDSEDGEVACTVDSI